MIVYMRVLLSSKEVFVAFERSGCLIDLATGVASSIAMILKILSVSNVMVWFGDV